MQLGVLVLGGVHLDVDVGGPALVVTEVGDRLTKGLVGRITVDPTATPALIGTRG